MRFGISTHLYHDRRLERGHLAQIGSYGFDAIELFATRKHFDYHDEAAIAALGGWLSEIGLTLNSVHAPISTSGSREDRGETLSNAAADNARRGAAVAETAAALRIAPDDPVRCARGPSRVAGDHQPAGRQHAGRGGSQR